MPPFNDVVYRFVDYPGEPTPFYLRHKAQLGQALQDARPAVGDIVALVRGADKHIGKPNPMQTCAVRARPADDPVRGTEAAPAAPRSPGGTTADDGIPFAPAVW